MRPTTKWERRDRKRHKRRHGMRVVGRSVLILDEQIKRRYNEIKRRSDRMGAKE